ncbi:MAG: glycosyltransferase family 39 protein [Polyangiaceae bacterium]|nr:glycosyltransferase family 39 protein [Polyangiaceae bacterium]
MSWLASTIRRKGTLFLVLAVAIASFVSHMDLVSASAPYSGHIDEPYLTTRAHDIIRTGELNPQFFRYGSLPIYLAAAGEALGIIQANKLERVTVSDLHWTPYYSHAVVGTMMRTPFVLAGCACLVLVGLIARRLYGSRLAMVTATLSATSLPLLHFHTWAYANVDILVTFFCLLTSCYVLWTSSQQTYQAKSFIPGVLCGLAISCKYTAGVMLLIPLLSIFLYGRRSRLRLAAALLVSSALSFFVVMPYALLDLAHFLDDVGAEVFHYNVSGHGRFTAVPGLPHLKLYLTALRTQLGDVGLGLAAVGFVAAFKRNPKLAAVAFIGPLSLLAYICTLKVNFLRNILVVFPFATIALGGAYTASQQIASLLRSRIPTPYLQNYLAPLVIGALMLTHTSMMPWYRFHVRSKPDTRIVLEDHLLHNFAKGSQLWIPEGAHISVERLAKHFNVKRLNRNNVPKSLSGGLWLRPKFANDKQAEPFMHLPCKVSFAVEGNALRKEISRNPGVAVCSL